MSKPDSKWQKLIDEKIKIQLVAHVTLGGKALGTISIDPKAPKDAAGYDNVKLEVFAGELSDDQMCVLRELVGTARRCNSANATSKLHQMELELAKISAYKFCLPDL